MASYMASWRLIEYDSAIYFPLEMPPVMQDIMFTMEFYVLGGAVLNGKNTMSEEYFNNTTPTEW